MTEGYIYTTYGKIDYLKHAVASVTTLRRYDNVRPVALFCSDEHRTILEKEGRIKQFQSVLSLPPEHQSIVGVKHHIDRFMVFDHNMFLDSDMIWCRNPDSLWRSLSAFDFTITGQLVADSFFGASKGLRILWDVLLRRRRRTLRRFGVTQLSRVQSGIIYAADKNRAECVCTEARSLLERRSETHFRSRLEEKGRSEETCEWSLGLAMSRLHMPVYPWFQGYNSPQLDFLSTHTQYDEDFMSVHCLYYCDERVFSLRGLQSDVLRKALTAYHALWPGRIDHMWVTPYLLHFGWLHDKQPFRAFAERSWNGQ